MQNGDSGGGGVRVALVLLAAGGSTRLGSPKQLLAYRGQSLLRHAAGITLGTACRPVVVVLGAGAERLREELAGLDVQVVVNPDWERGMGTSIRLGMAALEALAPGVDGVLFTLCDQPLVGAEKLDALVGVFRENRASCQAVSAVYNGTRGVPALFGRALFAELAALPDEGGAKTLLGRPGVTVGEFPLPEAAVDVDTRQQYEALDQGSTHHSIG